MKSKIFLFFIALFCLGAIILYVSASQGKKAMESIETIESTLPVQISTNFPSLEIDKSTVNADLVNLFFSNNISQGDSQFFFVNGNAQRVFAKNIHLLISPLEDFDGKYFIDKVVDKDKKIVKAANTEFIPSSSTLVIKIFYDKKLMSAYSYDAFATIITNDFFSYLIFAKGSVEYTPVFKDFKTLADTKKVDFTLFKFKQKQAFWERFNLIEKAYASCNGGYDCGQRVQTCTCPSGLSCPGAGAKCTDLSGTCACTPLVCEPIIQKSCTLFAAQSSCLGGAGQCAGVPNSNCTANFGCSWSAPSTTPGPSPTPGGGGSGTCSDQCYPAAPNCGSWGKTAGSGSCAGGQLCCKDIPSGTGVDMGAYAYCQDPGGPVYPLPGLTVQYDSYLLTDPWGASQQSQQYTTDVNGRAFIVSKQTFPLLAGRFISINGYNSTSVTPLASYTTQTLSTGQMYKNLQRGPSNITMTDCYNTLGNGWKAADYTYVSPVNGKDYLCGPVSGPNMGDPTAANKYIFDLYSYGSGQYNAVWHFTGCEDCSKYPPAVTTTSPVGGSSIPITSTSDRVTISWTAVANATQYDVEVYPLGGSCVSTGAACALTAYDQGVVGNSYTFTPSTYTYTYRVRGVNTACVTHNYGEWSPLTTFSLTSLVSGTVYIDNSGTSAPSGGLCSAPGALPAYTSPANGTKVTASNPLLNTQAAAWIPIAGDWTGSGVTTTGLYDPSTATFHLKTANASGTDDISFIFGAAGVGMVPIAGDWDGNGTTTIGVYNPANAVFSLRNSNSAGPADAVFTFGNPGFTPIAGDWDGNGTWTIGLYDPATSIFYLRNSNTTGIADMTFLFGNGGAGWIPVSGDWDGNGTSTVALYAQAINTFYIKNTNGGGVFSDANVLFGSAQNAFMPLAGKWSGSIGIGAYDPTITTFYLRNSVTSGGADTTFQYTGSNTGGYAPGFVTASGTYSITGLPFQPAVGAGQTGATLTLTDSTYACICPTGCSYGAAQNTPKTNLNFYIGRAGSAWYQTIGGDVAANTASGVVVNDQINAFCTTPACEPYLILPPTGATGQSYGSLTIKTNSYADLTDQSGNQESNVGPTGFSYLVKTTTPQSTAENYNYFYRLYSMGTTPAEDFAVPTSATLPGSAPAGGKLAYYRGGDMTIDSNWNVTAGNSYVIFVNGDLTVGNSATITVVPGAFLSFIVSGNITFDSSIGTATFASTGPGQIQGVYIANGVLKVESAGATGIEKKFIGEGTFVGYSGIRLPRDFSNGGNGTQNNNYPASLFVHRPDFVINTPARMKKAVMNWREVEP